MDILKKLSFVLLAAIMIMACGQKKEDESLAKEKAKEERVFPVRVEAVKTQIVPKTLEYTANLNAYKEIYFAPASPGRVDKVYVEVGDRVNRGQLLVELDRTQLSQATTQLKSAESNYKRIKTLFELKSISEQQFDQAKTAYDLAKSNVDFLMQNTTLVSPINGIVTGKYFESGEMYSGAPNTQAGKAAIVTLMQINPLKAVVSIAQSYFPVIKEGTEVKITNDIYPSMVFSGKIATVYPTIEQATRMFKVEIIVENDDEKLRPGMFARFELDLDDTEATVVPAIAVLKQEGTNNRYVFVHQNGTAKQVEVELGKRHDDMVEIVSEKLKLGMQLIVEGQANLINGSKVKVVE